MAINLEAILNIAKINLPNNALGNFAGDLSSQLEKIIKPAGNVVRVLNDIKSAGGNVDQAIERLGTALSYNFDQSTDKAQILVKAVAQLQSVFNNLTTANTKQDVESLRGEFDRLSKEFLSVAGATEQTLGFLVKLKETGVAEAINKIGKEAVKTREQLVSGFKQATQARINSLGQEIKALEQYKSALEAAGKASEATQIGKTISTRKGQATKLTKQLDDVDVADKTLVQRTEKANKAVQNSDAKRFTNLAKLERQSFDQNQKERLAKEESINKAVANLEKRFISDSLKEQSAKEKAASQLQRKIESERERTYTKNNAKALADFNSTSKARISQIDREVAALRKLQEVLLAVGKIQEAEQVGQRIVGRQRIQGDIRSARKDVDTLSVDELLRRQRILEEASRKSDLEIIKNRTNLEKKSFNEEIAAMRASTAAALKYLRQRESALRKLIRETEKLEAIEQRSVNAANARGAPIDSATQAIGSRIVTNRQRIALERGIVSGLRSNLGLPNVEEKDIKKTVELSKAVTKVNEAFNRGQSNATKFGDAIGLATKRFSAFIIGSAPIFLLINAFRLATREALKFEEQLTKIEQVIDATRKQSNDVSKAIRQAALATGTAASEVAESVQVFAQAGFQDPKQLAAVAEQIAKIPLTATFGTTQETTEGLIAVFGQFNKGLADTADILDLVNQLAADFAAESGDLFEAVKRGGAAFATAGGSLEEFLSLFTVLRSASRESAEALGTFLKTGFAQLLSKGSQERIKALGIQSETLVDQLKDLGELFNSPNSPFTRIQKIQIAEELTGQRNFNRFLTLIQEISDPAVFAQLEESLGKASGSVDRTVGRRLDDVGKSFERVKIAFNDFVTEILKQDSIKQFTKILADIAIAATNLTTVLGKLIPAIAGVGAVLGARTFANVIGAVNKRFNIGSIIGFGDQLPQRALGPAAFAARLQRSEKFRASGRAEDPFIQQQELRAERFERIRRGRRFQRNREIAIGGLGAGLLLGGSLLSASDNRNTRTGGNVAIGAGAGITAGAAIGSVFPGVGTGIGALIGGLVGALTALKISLDENVKETRKDRIRNAPSSGQALQAALSTGELFKPINQQLSAAQIKNLSRFNTGPTPIQDFTSKFDAGLITKQLEKILLNDISELTDEQKDVRSVFQDINKEAVTKITDNIRKFIESSGGNFEVTSTTINTLIQDQIDLVTDQFSDQLKLRGFDEGAITQAREKIANAISSAIDTNVLSKIDKKQIEQINQEFNARLSQVGIQFVRFARSLDNIFLNLNSQIENLDKSVSSQVDDLNSIITNIFDVPSIKLPTNTEELLQSFNFTGIADIFQKTSQDLSDRLTDLLNNPEFSIQLDALATGLKDSRGDVDILFSEVFKGLGAEGSKAAQDIIQQLAAESGKNVSDILEALSGLDNTSVRKFVDDLRGGEETINKLAQSIRNSIEAFNQQLQIENTLLGNIRNLNQELFDLNQTIIDTTRSMQDRAREQLEFTNNVSGLQSTRNAANINSQRANQAQFSNTNNFITDLLTAAGQAATEQRQVGERNRSGQIDLQATRNANNSNNRLLDLQQELGQRLSDLDSRLSSAASATDLLKSAFTEFKNQIKAAGAAVTGFTVGELSEAFAAFDKFASLSDGLKNIGTGLEGLTDLEFGSVQKLLQAAGEFNLGKGISGADILGQINEELGLPLLAAIRSRVTGETTDAASQAIKQELASIKAQQEQAFAVEQQLRNEQISLLQAQSQLIPIEQQFYKDQLIALNDINISLDPIKSIAESTNRLFRELLPVTLDNKTTKSIGDATKQNTNNIPTPNIPVKLTPTTQPIIPNEDIRIPERKEIPGRNPFSPSFFPEEDPLGIKKQREELRRSIPDLDKLVPNLPDLSRRKNPFGPSFFPDEDPLGIKRRRQERDGEVDNFFRPRQIVPGIQPRNPADPQFIGQNPETIKLPETFNTLDKNINSTSGAFEALNNSINNYNKALERIIQNNTPQAIAANSGINSTLEIAPIQVNVALAAPDILALAGKPLRDAILREIIPAISEAFGVVGEEPKSVFNSRIPRI